MEKLLYNSSSNSNNIKEKLIKDLIKDMKFNQKIINDFRDNYLKNPLENSYNDKIEIISLQNNISNLLDMFEKSIIVTIDKLKIIQNGFNNISLKSEFIKKNNNFANKANENKNNFTQTYKILNSKKTSEKKNINITDSSNINNSSSSKIIYNDYYNNMSNSSGKNILNKTENNNNSIIIPRQKKVYYFNFNYDSNKVSTLNKEVSTNNTNNLIKSDLLSDYPIKKENRHNTNDFIGMPKFKYKSSNRNYNLDDNKASNYHTITNNTKKILKLNKTNKTNNKNLTNQNYSNDDIIFNEKFNKNYNNFNNNYNNYYNSDIYYDRHNYNIANTNRGENGQIRNSENLDFNNITGNINNNYYNSEINEINNNNSNNDLNNKNFCSISHSIRPQKNTSKLTNIKNKVNNNEIKKDVELKSSIREILKKLKKNSPSSKKYYSNNNNKIENILNQIQNSQNLIQYFSEKYGKGDFNIFINKFNNKNLDLKIIENEINIISKIVENNNNNALNKKNNNKDYLSTNHLSTIDSSNQIHHLPIKLRLKKNNSQNKNRTKIAKDLDTNCKNKIERSTSKKILSYRTDTPSQKSSIMTKRNESDDINIFLNNSKQISTIYGSSSRVCPSSISKCLRTDEYYQNNNKELLTKKNPFKNNIFCNRLNYKQIKTPLNSKNSMSYS